MDFRERFEDREEAIRSAFDNLMAGHFVSLVGIVNEDSDGHTVKVQPSVKAQKTDQHGKTEWQDYPLLQDVPLHFPSGGGTHMTFPVKKGDEVLVVFASRHIDAWQQSGGVQKPVSTRMHSLSDGFAFAGFRSNPKKLQNVSTTAAEMRSTDGNTKVSLDPAAGVSVSTNKAVSVNAAEGVAINGGAGNVTMTGTLTITGDVIANGISLVHHVHSGVVSGGANTAEPVA